MRWVRHSCGCLVLMVALIVSLPLMAVGYDNSTASAGGTEGTLVPPGPNGEPTEVAWTPLFPWTPATGEPSASGWPWGQCTWFVASEGRAHGDHQVGWSGDAWQWYGAAARAGYVTEPPTTSPEVGWIAVFARGHGSDSSTGHVAVVVGVTDTTYTVAEAHVLGLGIVDDRTLPLPGSAGDGGAPLVEGWIP